MGCFKYGGFMGTRTIKLKDIASAVDGRLVGSGRLEIRGIRSLDLAGPDEISFAVGTYLEEDVRRSSAGALILPEKWPLSIDRPAVLVRDPYLACAIVASLFNKKEFEATGINADARIGTGCSISDNISIHAHAYIGDRVVIGPYVTIYPGVYIGDDAAIGEGCVIYPNVVIYKGCRIGKRVTIHAGAVIGSDGFGYARRGDESVKIPQIGIVVIEDDVEIGANVTIDRATFGETRIGRGTKIDNLVQIGHNVTIGPGAVIVAQVGIAGSARLGSGVMLGGHAGILGHIELGDGVKVGAMSGVAKSVPAGEAVSGIPAIPHKQWLRVMNVLKRLPEMEKEIRRLKEGLETGRDDRTVMDTGGQDDA
ncbi:MAG: UDP-3-O-(3-hydroxymyristoyl)glucosamine N-acyltransferase [Dissulfurimicrobium sp.]|uniref:UDP-3-O-(3-hydroxymyristoyl)glucosamine N-acyltransferase n=1 Tax=Dissulfurimicrobium TaxID=1769732 RepID=UPI001ED9E6D0|nr:UDP-3-O-(3-hydroxymyristoyl)glucosamine N-acyltransferase [Dissulfurimicrobium hydrothermale]UKL13742.1 UDP-3-O-(3-hydroxymyristoyl)glucosamine N-acyltransferase [Dissulfurimicrobium hydrothermale]